MLSRTTLMAVSIVALLSCGERAQPLAPTEGPVAHRAPSLVNGDSDGLTRMTFPAEFPGIPAYARIEALTAAQAGLRLMECNLNSRNLADGGFGQLSAFARRAPAIVLRYGDFAQLEGVLDTLARLLLESDLGANEARTLLTALLRNPGPPAPAPASEAPRYDIPAPTPRKEPRKMTIGMATYDDYDGVYFSLQALRMYHPEVMDDVELLVIDNHPDGPCGSALKALKTTCRTSATCRRPRSAARRSATWSSMRPRGNSSCAWIPTCSWCRGR